MPNWCENDLTIRGNTERLKEFRERANGDDGRELDFNRFIPYPEKYRRLDARRRELKESGVAWRELPKDGFNQGGYEWCIKNWDTKWNAVRCSVNDSSIETDVLTYHFETAWTPPKSVILKMAEEFPDLRFSLDYYEQGCGFSGQLVIHRGKVIQDYLNQAYTGDRGG